MATGGSICHYYNTPRGCWYGDKCWFIHDVDSRPEQISVPKTRRCRYYRLPSGCRYGDMCCFRHDDDETRGQMVMYDLSYQMKSLTVYDEKHNWEGLEKEEHSFRANYDSSHDVHGAANVKHEDLSDTGEEPDGRYCSDEECYEDNEEEVEEEEHDDDDDDDDDDDSGDKAGRKLDKWMEEKEDQQKPEINKATCGECGSLFIGEDAFDMLWSHYLESFRKFDYSHLKFLIKDARLDKFTTCIICDKGFARARDLLRHTVHKSERDDKDGEEHLLVLERGIVEPFSYRDTVYHDDDRLKEELVLTLCNSPLGDPDDEDDFFDFLRFGLMFGGGGGGGFVDGDDDSDDGGMFGFSNSDCEELLCQGVKPWDPEAGDVLAALNDWGY